MTRRLSLNEAKKLYRHVEPATGGCVRKGVTCPEWLEYVRPIRRVERVGIDTSQAVAHPTRVSFRDDTTVVACRYCRLPRVN